MSEQEIIQTVGLYAVALDSHSWDLFDAVIAADVVSDYPGGLFWSDLASFKAGFPAVGDGCKGCHEKFRAPLQ